MAGIDIDLNNVPSDPEALAKVFEQLESGPTTADPTPEPQPAPKDDPTPASATQVSDDPAKKDQQTDPQGTAAPAADEHGDPAGVATKDGKHVIPYSVLKSERDRASRAEQLANEMKERVAALEAQVQQTSQGAKPGESARTNPAEPNASDLSPEDLEALKEDFPTIYKAVTAAMANVKALEAKLKPVEENVQQAEADRQRTVAEQVQDAIDSVPKLAHLQSSDKEAFDMAKQFDATLRGQKAWAEKPLAERFTKVVEMVEAALGPINVPGMTPPPSQPSAEDLKKAAQAKAAAAAKSAASVPTSLSEFPAGQPPAQDERQAAESLSVLQLADKFASMTPDQMDAYFRTL